MRFLAPLALAFLLPLAASAGDRYVPRVDPHEPVRAGEAPVVWRGDQMHPRPLSGAPDEGPWVFHVDDFRWTFRPPDEADARWKPVFLPVRLDTRKVKAIHHIWSPFFPEAVAGHSAMLLELEPGGLTRLGDGGVPEEALPDPGRGVVLSVEARMKRGETYGFLAGLKGDFELVYSLSTEANYRQRCLDVYQGEWHRWELNLDAAEARWVARAALEDTLQDHRGETYWLTRRSCSTEFMDILIEGLERGGTAEARAEAVAGLRQNLETTREADLGLLEQAWGGIKAVGRALNPLRWLGMTRDNVERTTPLGLFVNPLMSMPAQLPGVLHRRGLLDSSDADEVREWQAPPAPPGFEGLEGE